MEKFKFVKKDENSKYTRLVFFGKMSIKLLDDELEELADKIANRK